MMKACGGYLDLGTDAIRLTFSSGILASQAGEHIILKDKVHEKKILEIDYVEDDSIQNIVPSQARPNAVFGETEDLGGGRARIVFNMFAKFTFLLHVQKGKVVVQYPPRTPIIYLLDEVLQMALTPLLKEIGGFLMHGSCVVKDGEAMVFMGMSGSGKSATAFNLTRFGYKCYADDWVLVTSGGDGDLQVWPAVKGFSIRPLSFRFFEEQGIRLTDPRKEGIKYYFQTETSAGNRQAILKNICFVEVSGEPETSISRFDPEEAHRTLLSEKRYFPLSIRKSAPIYAKILVERVPGLLHVRAGLGLNAQAKAIREAALGGTEAKDRVISRPEKSKQASRKDKISLIQESWASPGREPLENLIPLLGNYDLKMFTLAYAFFLTDPTSRLETLQETIPFGCAVPGNFQAPWLRTLEWMEGARTLVQQSGEEVFRQFCLSWIKAAPHIYPFLNVLADKDPGKSQQVRDSWKAYKEEKESSAAAGRAGVEVHLVDSPAASDWIGEDSRDRWRALFSSKGRSLHVYYWSSRVDKAAWEEVAEFFKAVGTPQGFTVVPVCSGDGDVLAGPVEFIRMLGKSALCPRISRLLPLCRLADEEGAFLLNAGAMEAAVTDHAEERYHWTARGPDSGLPGNKGSLREATWAGEGITFREKPFSTCGECGLHSLGFCLGGFFKT
ncbi:hypothetical protein ACFL4G_04130 [Thermodesulfobacteriota bacterium]